MKLRTPGARVLGGQWHVRLLGGFEVRNGDVAIDRFPSRAAQLLLVRLALAAGRPLRKEALIDWLWPGAEPARARHNLRTARFELKRLLEPPGAIAGSVIGGDRETLLIRAGAVHCDALVFEQHVRQGEADLALAAYAGELAPGLMDDFIDAERIRLQDLFDQIERQPGAPGGRARRDAPPAPPAAVVLPDYGPGFIARAFELQWLLDATAQGSRLVVVTGPGGCGKTRLSVEAARRAKGFEFVGFVALDQCTEVPLIAEHVRAVRGLQAGARSTLDQVVADLEGRRALLLLDNFEQFDAAQAAAWVSALQRRLPELHLWISSRNALDAEGAVRLALEPLSLPAPGDGPAAALRAPSVALFAARVRMARADFQVHGRNVAAVVALCRLLEGLPLAIELAAARIRQFSPAELCAAIEADWSAIARIGAPARQTHRHASIERLIDWSLRLLSDETRAFAACLTVFEGGWTVEQAAAAAMRALPESRRQLDELVACSLLQRPEAGAGGERWRMLGSVRDTLRKRSDETLLRQARARVRSFFLEAAARPVRLEDATNLAASLAGALHDGETGSATALLLAWQAHWAVQGLTPAAAAAVQALAQRIEGEAPAEAEAPDRALRCRALCGATPLLFQAGRSDAARRAVRAALALSGDDPALCAQARIAHVNCFGRSAGDGEKFGTAAREALAWAERAGSDTLRARALIEVGRCRLDEEGDIAGAEQAFVEAERALLSAGDEQGALRALPGRLACLNRRKEFAEMAGHAIRGSAMAARLGDLELQMLLMNRHGVALEGLRRWRQALEVHQRMARIASDRGMAYHFAYAVWNQPEPLMRLRQWRPATVLLGFAVRYWTGHFAALTSREQADLASTRARLREHLPDEAAAWDEGWALPVADGIALAAGRY